jgi:Reverse transcriptase (RNA-dependent DNA polymerase)
VKPWDQIVPPHYHMHQKVFSKEVAQCFPDTRPWDHAIDLKPDAPDTLDCKVYPLGPGEQEVLQKFLKEHLDKGYICPSKSPYASPFFFIKKKDRKLHLVQDYRKLNALTICNRYPLPLIPELIDRIRGHSLFTKLDIWWDYNNIRIRDGDQWKAAFKTNQGLFEPMVMFFGLTNLPAMFQTMMNHIFRDLIDEGYVTVYMDDILIHTPNDPSLHQNIVHCVLKILSEHHLYLKLEKCQFKATTIEYLGVVVEGNQLRMDPAKVTGILSWPCPKTVRDVHAFIGFCLFYRC